MRYCLTLALCAATVLTLAACAPVTRTAGASFTDPAFAGRRVSSVIVEADTPGLQERQGIERSAADALRRAGVAGQSSLDIIPPTRAYSGVKRQRMLAETGAQSVLLITPVDKDIVCTYFPPSYHGPIGGYGAGYNGGFGYGGPYMSFHHGFYDPGYVVNEPRVRYRAVLYALPDYRQIWTAELTVEGAGGMGFDTVGERFGGAVVQRLIQDGVIAAKR